jgi:hypothetical protein
MKLELRWNHYFVEDILMKLLNITLKILLKDLFNYLKTKVMREKTIFTSWIRFQQWYCHLSVPIKLVSITKKNCQLKITFIF